MNKYVTREGLPMSVTFTCPPPEPREVSIEVPDPDWKFRDRKGHVHRWTIYKRWRRANAVKTITWVEDEEYWCDCCQDYHTEGHWACQRCGEEVEPGYRPGSIMIPSIAHFHSQKETTGEFETTQRRRFHDKALRGEKFNLNSVAAWLSGRAIVTGWESIFPWNALPAAGRSTMRVEFLVIGDVKMIPGALEEAEEVAR